MMFLLRFDILAILKNDFPGHGKLQRGPGGLLAHFMAEKDARCASVRHLTLNPQAWGLSLAAFMHPNERLAEICLTTSGTDSPGKLRRGVSIDPRAYTQIHMNPPHSYFIIFGRNISLKFNKFM